MPSIPQSLLWISLVVLWLFVLVPMLISKRDAVRRTSDVALATRVLNGGAGGGLFKRKGPAAGHRSDPDWQPEEDWDTERIERPFAAAEQDADTVDLSRSRQVVTAMARVDQRAVEAGESDYLDVDVVDEHAAALPLGASARAESVDEHAAEADDELADDEYEYIEDSSGLEPTEDGEDGEGEEDGEDGDEAYDGDAPPAYATGVNRRRRFDNKNAAAVSARKYAFRKRVLVAMAVILVGSAIAAFEVTPSAWWLCATATTITLLYLFYLRRQTKIEEKVRRRRMQRVSRSRLGVENAEDREYDLVPARLRRPGAIVLEIDDEDPIFEHLDYAVPMRNYGWPGDLQRAVGQ